jgi:hypothetical protein
MMSFAVRAFSWRRIRAMQAPSNSDVKENRCEGDSFENLSGPDLHEMNKNSGE